MASSPQAIGAVAQLLALKLTTPDLALEYLEGDDEAVDLAVAIAKREPASVVGEDAAKLTSVAKNLLTLGLSDLDTLAAGLAEHPEGDAIAETAKALADQEEARSLNPFGRPWSVIKRRLKAQGVELRTPEELAAIKARDAEIMKAAAAKMGLKLDAELHPISAAACTAGRHHWGPKDHRGFRQCQACEVWSVVDHDNPGAIYSDHDSEAVVETSATGRMFTVNRGHEA
jgi:hypothetical protein